MRTIIIDRSEFAEADDGDTTHYGGEITLIVIETNTLWWKLKHWWHTKRWFKDTRHEMTYCCRGTDRSGLDAWRYEGSDLERIKYTLDEEFTAAIGDAQQLYDDVNIRVR